jgi:hypothetical protein
MRTSVGSATVATASRNPVGDAGHPVGFARQQTEQFHAGYLGYRHEAVGVSRAGGGPGSATAKRRRSRYAVTLVCPRPS